MQCFPSGGQRGASAVANSRFQATSRRPERRAHPMDQGPARLRNQAGWLGAGEVMSWKDRVAPPLHPLFGHVAPTTLLTVSQGLPGPQCRPPDKEAPGTGWGSSQGSTEACPDTPRAGDMDTAPSTAGSGGRRREIDHTGGGDHWARTGLPNAGAGGPRFPLGSHGQETRAREPAGMSEKKCHLKASPFKP